ncbi:MAG: InlB B-repeat-containing protein [Clostridia bacterium]|nr:InlB B-repeat-containing protein [Clostridia bacterium]
MKRLVSLLLCVIMVSFFFSFVISGEEEKAYCITLDANGGKIEGKSVYGINFGDRYCDIFGDTIPNAVREGYTLAGWLCEKYNYILNVKNGDYYAVYENTVFRAVWIDDEGNSPDTVLPEKSYMISFDANGGMITEGESIYYINTGERYIDVMDKAPAAVREGFEFIGWYCEKYQYLLNVNQTDSFTVQENVVFKALWERTDRDYTVTLDPNGGEMNGKTVFKIDRNEFYVDRIGETMPKVTKQGYTFCGWYNEKYDFMLSISATSYHKYDESLTFVAKWEKNKTPETQKDLIITLDGNGGDVIGQSVYGANLYESYQSIFGKIPNAYRPGYTLAGWYCEKYYYTLDMSANDCLAVNEDVVFKAVWKKNNYMGVGTDGFNVIIADAENISHIRYAKGSFDNASDIKNALDCVDLNERVIGTAITDGYFIKELPDTGNYSFWIKYKDTSSYVFLARITAPEEYVSVKGVTVDIKNLYGVRDIFVAKGNYNSYSEVKNNGGVRISDAKIAGRHSYSYMAGNVGEYTLCIRYTDSSRPHKILKTTVSVDMPVFCEKGLQLEISNLNNVKVIRTAYGEFTGAGEIKRAEGSRGYSGKSIDESFTLSYKNEGVVTVAVVYQNGYTHIYKYSVTKKTPEIEALGNSIYLSKLTGMSVIRYTKGVYNSVGEIKNSPDNRYIKTLEGDSVVISDLEEGRYTVYVQYKDSSEALVHLDVTNIPIDAKGVKVSSAFTDNMVLQRDEKLSVWGFAKESDGKRVAVTFGGKTAYATVENGEWKAIFDETFPYNTKPQDLKVYSAEGETVIKDVLVGDVYYIIGQSNTLYGLNEEINDLEYHGLSYELEVDFDNSRNMRFFRISNSDYWGITGEMKQGTAYEYKDVYNGRVWQKPSDVGRLIQSNAGSYQVFSALGYLFAYNMTNETQVPIGMIEIDASGHPLTSFAPNHLAQKWGDEYYDSTNGIYNSYMGCYSRYVYNQQIHPLRHFSIAGIIWYQGESDAYNTVEQKGIGASTFKNEFAELMTYFRSIFGNSDFPVYLNEFPAHTGGFDFGCSRVEVGVVPQILENSYVVPASDTFTNIKWHNSIHPYVKRIQAKRLCSMVLANRFGKGGIENAAGPILENASYNGTSVILDFKYTADGLTTFASEDFGDTVTGIEVMDSQGRWSKTAATIIDKDKISVNADFEIYGVRYYRMSAGYYPKHANICNSKGMPCVAFVNYK